MSVDTRRAAVERSAYVRFVFRISGISRALPPAARYGLTTLMLAIAAGLNPVVVGAGAERPFLTFYPVVVLAGVLFNSGTSFFAIAGSVALACYFFFHPIGSFLIDMERHFPAVAFFTISTLLVALLIEALHIAYADLARSDVTVTEQQMLRREAAHRSANDLQQLAAMIQLQSSIAADTASKQALNDVLDRVQALARVNRRLENLWGADDVTDARPFLQKLCEDLSRTVVGLRPVGLHVEAEAHLLAPQQLLLLGLIVNELVTNAQKYAFPDDKAGDVWVRLHQDGRDLVLEVEDNGTGHDPTAPASGTGLGTRLVRAFAAQLGGNVTLGPGQGGAACVANGVGGPGTRWTVRVPRPGFIIS